MTDKPKGRPVPTSSLARASGLGAVAGKIATSVVTNGAVAMLKGKSPKLSDLVLTPKNIQRLTDQLASMRGAAMKLGQLISLDNGELMAPELAGIMARLREDAVPMPKEQLQQVLDSEWGGGWKDNLLYFSYAPIASASIGQVHKAITLDGQMLAVKIQYPGIKESIDSDVNNVASLVKITGLLPRDIDIAPLLEEAKIQLHAEADYLVESAMLQAYQSVVIEDPELATLFAIPDVYSQWSSERTLAMTFMKSESLEVLEHAGQALKNRMIAGLFRLFFREVFDYKLIQSDPNLANYRYDPEEQKVVLLDFGATRRIPQSISEEYRKLLIAAANQDAQAMEDAAMSIGLIGPSSTRDQIDAVVNIGMTACEAIHQDDSYVFGESDLITRLQQLGMDLSYKLNFWHIPPADAVFIHRKLGGLFLIAKKLGCSINLRTVAAPWIN